jgi:hypothetical protein
VAVGHVSSPARPGGNVTGLSVLLTEIVAKQLEIMKQVLPHMKRIGVRGHADMLGYCMDIAQGSLQRTLSIVRGSSGEHVHELDRLGSITLAPRF